MTIPFVPSGAYPIRSGNLVRPLIDGEPAFRRICEAIAGARRSVWVTVTFLWRTFEMPDGQGSAFDVLDRAATRGLDVRLIFWRPDDETASLRPNAFWGSADQIALLEARRSGVKIRWDRAHPGFCQHQKSWLIDAADETETAFVGGINLNPHSMASPGHRGEGQNHDVYVELSGPSAVDVHHNFVQRWNEASERSGEDGRWGPGSETDLPFPVRVPARRGPVLIQVQRTVHAGRYTDRHPAPEAPAFEIASGERANFDQYRAAIAAARRSIYIENQALDVAAIIGSLHEALRRGIEVVVLMPAEMPPGDDPLAPLAAFETFTRAGIAGLGPDGRRRPVHIHSKLMIVDDVWATVGSCNLHRYSLFGNCEMNVAMSEPATVRALRADLLREHLGQDTSGLDDGAALRLFREIARRNARALNAGDHDWTGLAFSLDPAGRAPIRPWPP